MDAGTPQDDASLETDPDASARDDEPSGKDIVLKRRVEIEREFSRETDEEKRAKVIGLNRGNSDRILGHRTTEALILALSPEKAKEFPISEEENESPIDDEANEPIAIEQTENEETQEAPPPARDSSSQSADDEEVCYAGYPSDEEREEQPEQHPTSPPEIIAELSPEEKRVEVVQQCMTDLETIYDDIENDELNIVDQRCYNGCLKCSAGCFGLLKCCDCMEGCTKEGRCGRSCVACRYCAPTEKMSEDLKKAARIGSQLALTLVVPPREFLLLFWRSFELAFFVFSLAYAVVEAMDGFGDKRTLKIIALAFGVIDSCISIYDNVAQWRDTCKEIRDRRRKKKNFNLEKDAEANDVKKISAKGGGKFVAELMKKIVTYALIYPLLICDIYDIATPTQSDPNGVLEYVVFGVGCFLTILDVYLHRTYMLVKAAREIDKKRREIELVDDPMASTCHLSVCEIQWRLILHTVLVMIAHVFIVVAIAFEAIETNKDRADGVEALVSGTGMFMIACGLVLPLLSLGLFVGVNAFWVRAYFIDLFKSVCKEGEGLAKVVNDMGSASSRVSCFYRRVRSFETKAFRFADKMRAAFGDWRTIVVAVVYFVLMMIFVVLARANPAVAIGLAVTSIIADLLALSVAFYWLFILAVILLIVGTVVALVVLACVCCSCKTDD
ncbi:uncharacterized protein [Oscarella lobularis]|uniref:uncharacterized protein n=1 Tax=Oscarella lobularis TaxID=121494 RepID=UPI0033139E72